MSYPQYAASLFAGNDFCRSLFAFGAILFSRSMYINLGVGKGVSILGGLSVMGIVSRLRSVSFASANQRRLECGYFTFMGPSCERGQSLLFPRYLEALSRENNLVANNMNDMRYPI